MAADTTEVWAFAGTSLNTYATRVRSITGADTLPDLRGDDVVVPSRDGRFPTAKRWESRRVGLALWVSHLTSLGVDGSTPAQQARTNLDALLAILGKRRTASLVRTMPDGTTRTATAEVVSVDVPAYDAGRDSFALVVDFALADPWFYGADVVAGATTVDASPKAQAITHPGSVAGSRVTFDMVGPLSNVRVTNSTNGWYIEALVSVASGKHLLIDCDAATATNDGVNAIGSIRHSGGAELFRLEPGTNALSITSGTTGGSVTTTLKPPFA